MPLILKPTSPREPFTFSLSRSPTPESQNAEAPRPPADFLPEKDMYMFGAHPISGERELGRGLVKCGRCRKTGMEWAAGEHRRVCNHVLDGAPLVAKKGTKAGKTETKKRLASEDTSASPQKRSRLPSPSSSTMYDKYKGLKKSEIKKLQKDKVRAEKKEAKERERMEIAERKRQRANNPINLDKQCGVINDKDLPCARSLTCKTHTVGAKRAVQGRTRSYDELYLDWQREHNPNFKEPANKKDKLEKKKEKKKRDDEDEDGVVVDGEEGKKEIGELIALTRMAGERCRNTISKLGVNPSAPTNPSSPALLRPQPAAARVSKKPPFQPVWRSSSSSSDFTDVGRMLVQALAARNRPSTLLVNAATSAGVGNMTQGAKKSIPIQSTAASASIPSGGGVRIPAV
ncbi:uncharacterized protein L203_105202 [Cryptococcus depauperatus CBS 7841]|uniref:Uncharacterized protein n=1 Tax=Cryptococcus depauperatus CBS 7841 TaxID=1295531 RepID=A0A1E3HD95_9TREE|nr:SAGA-associated factor 73 [Cryptococcus depauperatus CBS 7841]